MMRALDLFSGAGGAAKGLRDAGFYVVGVDIKSQPRYAGHEHHVADAMTYPLEGFDFIWASPPCQRYSVSTVALRKQGREYPDLLAPTRHRLKANSTPYAIENVVGAPMKGQLVLCGSMFGLNIIRHRVFETSFAVDVLVPRCQHTGDEIPIYGHGTPSWHRNRKGRNFSTAEKRVAMKIDWMTRDELAESIPPAYSHFIASMALRATGAAPANDNGEQHAKAM